MSDERDGVLSWWRRALLHFHLSFCRTCPAVRASLERTVEGLHALRDVPPPEGP